MEGHEGVVSAVHFTPDGKRLVSGSWDETVRVWDVQTGTPVATLAGHTDWVFDVVVGTDGKRLGAASQRAVRWWNAETLAELSARTGLGGGRVNSVAFSADGRRLATGGRDGTAKVWALGDDAPPDAEPETVFTGFESWINAVRFSPDGKTLTTGSRIGRIRLFDLTTGKQRAELKSHGGKQVLALAVDPDSETLASGGFDAAIQVWDLKTGEERAKLTGHKGGVTALAWSPDGRWLASGERHGHVKLWDARNGYELATTLPGHSDDRLGFSVTALAFSPDGRTLASGGYDATLKLWPLPEEE